MQRCAELWGVVAEAEALRDASEAEQAQQAAEAGARPGQVAGLQERLAALRGDSVVPGAVWLRAKSALVACSS